jgi:hypothetical protein
MHFNSLSITRVRLAIHQKLGALSKMPMMQPEATETTGMVRIHPRTAAHVRTLQVAHDGRTDP